MELFSATRNFETDARTSSLPEPDDRDRLELIAEGRVLARYLLRSEPSPAALERYAAACRSILVAPASPEDRAMLGFVRRHPWSLPPLDATAALMDPQALLRKKLFLMLAILETTTTHVDVFTPQPRAAWRALLRVAWLGVMSVLLVVVGLFVYGQSRRAT